VMKSRRSIWIAQNAAEDRCISNLNKASTKLWSWKRRRKCHATSEIE
jgi:hypothetical protein